MTFGGRLHSVEDNLWWKMTCGGRRPAVKDNLQRRMTFAGSLHAAYSALRHFLKTALDIWQYFVLFSLQNIPVDEMYRLLALYFYCDGGIVFYNETTHREFPFDFQLHHYF